MNAMTRRPGGVLRVLGVIVVIALVVTSCNASADDFGDAGETSGAGTVTQRVNDGPNMVLISTDDQALLDLRWMPRTRKLIGDRGARFTNFIAPHPLCCPSRAQLLTGQYAQNNGVRGNRGVYGGYRSLVDPEHTLPVWLKDAGYRTSFIGKYVNGYQPSMGIPEGWQDWDATVRLAYRGFMQYDGNGTSRPFGYHTDYVADRTTQEIGRLAGADQPFFLWSSFYAPHGICSASREIGCATPPEVARRFADKYAGVRAPSLDSPSFNEKTVSDKPRYVIKGGKVDRRKVQRLFTQRIRSLASVDLAVARIVKALRRAGELDDTVIAFISDNGYLNGEHRFQGKKLAYEESVRVPLLIRGPGIPAGTVLRHTTAMIDLAPTFADLGGAEATVPVDGQSLLELLRQREGKDRTLLVQSGLSGPDPLGLGWHFVGVRTKRYTLVYWFTNGFVELYDRRRDPYQIHNVADRDRYRQTLEELARRTRELIACAGESCHTRFGRVPAPRRPSGPTLR
jgi:arylsulfatase A-like enzyme